MRWLTTFLNCWRIELLFNCYPHSKAHKYNAIRQAEMYHWYLIYFLPQKLAQVQKFAALVVALQNDDRKFTAQWRKTTFLFPISIFETSVYNRAKNRILLAAQFLLCCPNGQWGRINLKHDFIQKYLFCLWSLSISSKIMLRETLF